MSKINPNSRNVNPANQNVASLLDAIRTRNIDQVKNIVEEQDVNADDCTRVLYMAAWTANIEIIEYLVEKGANIDDKQAGGFGSILHAAVRSRDENTVKYLLLANYLQPKGLLKRIIEEKRVQVYDMDENEINELNRISESDLENAYERSNMLRYLIQEEGMQTSVERPIMMGNVSMNIDTYHALMKDVIEDEDTELAKDMIERYISKAIKNKDTELAKKLIEQHDIDLDFIYDTENYFTCYYLALNTELAIHLIENKGLDVNKTFRNHNGSGDNILDLIMMYAKDIELMKYVIEMPNIDTSSIYHNAGTFLTFSCKNISLDGVVYLAKNMEENGVNNVWSILQKIVEDPEYLFSTNEKISKKNALVQYLKEEKGIQADVNISPNEVEDTGLLLGDVSISPNEVEGSASLLGHTESESIEDT